MNYWRASNNTAINPRCVCETMGFLWFYEDVQRKPVLPTCQLNEIGKIGHP